MFVGKKAGPGGKSLGVTQGLAVKVVFTMTWTNTLEIGYVVSKLLDGLNLLMQVVALDEVSHLQQENILS